MPIRRHLWFLRTFAGLPDSPYYFKKATCLAVRRELAYYDTYKPDCLETAASTTRPDVFYPRPLVCPAFPLIAISTTGFSGGVRPGATPVNTVSAAFF